MLDPEYDHIKINNIPKVFIEEYKLASQDCDGWIYFGIHQGCHGL
jgi:hypothetical protein